jgi:hypothetical protein
MRVRAMAKKSCPSTFDKILIDFTHLSLKMNSFTLFFAVFLLVAVAVSQISASSHKFLKIRGITD